MQKPYPATAADRIRQTLEDQIVNAELPPGLALDEALLAQRCGVSRTPVRDALLQLSAQGFVHIKPRVGIFVAALEPGELANMFETLAYLEGLCAGLASQRITKAARRDLLAAHRDAEPDRASARPGGYAAANFAFHDVLYRASGNDYLVQQIMAIRKRTHPYRLRHFDQPGRLACSWREHSSVLDAVLDGDERAASQAATRHIVEGGQQFREFAERFPQGLYASVGSMRSSEQAAPAAATLAWLYGPRTAVRHTNPVN